MCMEAEPIAAAGSQLSRTALASTNRLLPGAGGPCEGLLQADGSPVPDIEERVPLITPQNYCHQRPQDFLRRLCANQGKLGLENGGVNTFFDVIFSRENTGTCFWNAELIRKASYLTMFDTRAPKQNYNGDQIRTIARDLIQNRPVTINGFRNMTELLNHRPEYRELFQHEISRYAMNSSLGGFNMRPHLTGNHNRLRPDSPQAAVQLQHYHQSRELEKMRRRVRPTDGAQPEAVFTIQQYPGVNTAHGLVVIDVEPVTSLTSAGATRVRFQDPNYQDSSNSSDPDNQKPFREYIYDASTAQWFSLSNFQALERARRMNKQITVYTGDPENLGGGANRAFIQAETWMLATSRDSDMDRINEAFQARCGRPLLPWRSDD